MAPALVLDRLTVQLGGRPVVDNLSLTAAPGRITALLGPNGAGKTTSLRCCTGLITPTAGRVLVLGQPPGSPAVTAAVGFMPQSTGAWSGIRARELLAYLARLYAHPQPVDDLVAALNIGGFADTPYRRLSGGQQQAVNLAAAIIGRPALVFLDEPTAGMDPHARRRAWNLMAGMREAGVSIVLTTHAMDEAAHLADWVAIMDKGSIRVAGTVADLTRTSSLEDVFLANTTAGPA